MNGNEYWPRQWISQEILSEKVYTFNEFWWIFFLHMSYTTALKFQFEIATYRTP